MPKISIQDFKGIAPRRAGNLLPPNVAEAAENARLSSGNIRALRRRSDVFTLGTPQQNDAEVRSLFRHRVMQNGSSVRLWVSASSEQSIIASPVFDDPFGRMYFTSPDGLRVTTKDQIINGMRLEDTSRSYLVGVPEPTAGSPATWAQSAPTLSITQHGTGTEETRAYVYTWVTAFGEEGSTSAPSEVTVGVTGATVHISGFAPVPAGHNITSIRIYRSNTGSAAALYQLVAERDAAITEFDDSVESANLGMGLETLGWLPPPSDIHSLVKLANGSIAGISGNQVVISEPYLPYAFPIAYRQPVPSTPVALGVMGNTIIVGTTANPHMITGEHPSMMSPIEITSPFPCVSARSMVSSEYGVFYATHEGLVLASTGGAELITRELMTQDDWQRYRPKTIRAQMWDGIYVAYYDTGTNGETSTGQGFTLNPRASDGTTLIDLSDHAHALFYDREDGDLYCAYFNGAVNNVAKFDGDTIPQAYRWRSSEARTGGAISFSAARVTLSDNQVVTRSVYRGDGALAGGAFAGQPVGHVDIEKASEQQAPASSVFRAIADGRVVFERVITSNAPFRITPVRTRSVQIEIEGNADIKDAAIASSVNEL